MKITERMVVVVGLVMVMILGLAAKAIQAKASCFDEKTQCAFSSFSNVTNDPNTEKHACH